MNPNPIGWIEIPVKDMKRAIAFNNGVFGFKLEAAEMGPLVMAMFPFDHNAPGGTGALVLNKEFYKPDAVKGPLVYFECKKVSKTLKKMADKGGKVIVPAKQISPEHGYMGVALDSEGNRIALHSNK